MSNIKFVLEAIGIAFASVFVLFVIYAKIGEISRNKQK